MYCDVLALCYPNKLFKGDKEVMKVSKFFELSKEQKDLDFINVDMSRDSALFINPVLIDSKSEGFLGVACKEKIEHFINAVYTCYAAGEKENAISLFGYSQEDNATHLGYSKYKSSGKGASEKALIKLFDKVCLSGTIIQKNVLTNPLSIVLFVADFAEDRMSDLLTSIMKKELVEYTLLQANLLDLPISDAEVDYGYHWDMDQKKWCNLRQKCVLGSDGKPLLLVPKTIVSDRYAFSVPNYLTKVIWVAKKALYADDYPKITNKVLKEKEIHDHYGNSRGAIAEYVLDQSIENPHYLEQYFDLYSNNTAGRYQSILTDEEITTIVDKSTL